MHASPCRPPQCGQRARRLGRIDQILDVAGDVFGDEGYSNASLSTVAARLGVSKTALYRYFDSKAALFAAYVERHCARLSDAVQTMADDGLTSRAALTLFVRRYLEQVVSESGVRHLRLVASTAAMFPGLGQTFLEAGDGNATRLISRYLCSAGLDGSQALTAARNLLALSQDRLLGQALCSYSQASSAELDLEVAAAMAVFWRSGPSQHPAPSMIDACGFRRPSQPWVEQ